MTLPAALPIALPLGLREIEPHGYVGIDFGTSNSHFAYCNLDGQLQAQSLPLGGLGHPSSVCTCVLWKLPGDKEEDILAFGDEALQEWTLLSAAERANHRFAAGFKPDLATSEQARHDTWGFLRRACVEISRSGMLRTLGAERGMPVVVGVPAEATGEHIRLTGEIAARAGFGTVGCMPEPLGALAFHLANNDLGYQEARQGVVVVDFGGGTLDLALVDPLEMRVPWGDTALGGRLFDDLFYQWLLEQNPGKSLSAEDRPFFWQVLCRRLKENFSRAWARKGDTLSFQEIAAAPDGTAWVFRNAKVDEFRARASAYRPSPFAQAFCAALGVQLPESGTLDLFAWIRKTLTPPAAIGTLKFRRVVLTGGSSAWPFLRELVAEVFGIGTEGILCSATPEIAIGSGLALYNVLLHRNEKRAQDLRGQLPARRAEFEQAVGAKLDQYARKIGEEVVDGLLVGVEGILLDWYRNGGSLRTAENRIAELCRGYDADIRKVVQGQQDRLAVDMRRLLTDHLRKWLSENDMPAEAEEFLPSVSDLQVAGAGTAGGPLERIGKEIADAVTLALAAVIGVVSGTICGGAGMALIMSGPLGWVLGFVIGVLGVFLGKQVLEEAVKSWDWGGVSKWTLHRAMSEDSIRRKIQESKPKLAETIAAGISREMTSLQRQAGDKFAAAIEITVRNLGLLAEFRKARTG